MALDFSNYEVPKARPLPVILLLDVSGSMDGDKIESLYEATVGMVKSFVEEEVKETIINIAIITFGNEVKLHTNFTPVRDLQSKGIVKFVASGMTPLGVALKMAKDIIEDKDIMPSLSYKPAVVLVSDGAPNDNWKQPLDDFINGKRSSRSQRFAIAIGNDADKGVLKLFTGNEDTVFFAEDAEDIVDNFKKVTMSVATRSKSTDPNNVPIPEKQFTYDNDDDDDDDDY